MNQRPSPSTPLAVIPANCNDAPAMPTALTGSICIGRTPFKIRIAIGLGLKGARWALESRFESKEDN
jgi:hypothetical protein